MSPHQQCPAVPSGRAALSCCSCPCSRHGFLPQRAPLLAGEDAREGRLPLCPRPLLQLLLVLEGNSQLLHDGIERKTLWGEGDGIKHFPSWRARPKRGLALRRCQNSAWPSGEGKAQPSPHGAHGTPQERSKLDLTLRRGQSLACVLMGLMELLVRGQSLTWPSGKAKAWLDP